MPDDVAGALASGLLAATLGWLMAVCIAGIGESKYWVIGDPLFTSREGDT